ncbi:MAG: type II toxin-antitoxin system RelE/ParE family toxin [Rhodospirillales bacterium]|nr:type II toxin-antitoxin system RelE/ParE family toxin [Rhodospirillales bacterium]
MHTVIETADYLKDARAARLSEAERGAVVDYLARHPDAGTVVPGTGGARKLRFAGRGKGKSGGYRVVTFYSGRDIPVFLLNVFAKGDKVDLSPAERNELRAVLSALVDYYRTGVKAYVQGRKTDY